MIMKVDFFKHNIDEIDIQNVATALKDDILTTGKTVEEFENKLANFLGIKHIVGVMSCTHAMEMALKAFEIGVGDEVITTPMTYIATADAIEYVGAKPIFADVEEETGNIDANLIEKMITPRTKAILPVHLYGQMCDMKKIRAIADEHGLKVIEDAAHCLEGERDGVRPGQLGDAVCFSFYATKSITCGEGGALGTNEDKMAVWTKKARCHGLSKDMAGRFGKAYKHYEKEFLGLKCNMSNIQAALLLHQLDNAKNILEQRERIAKLYDDLFLNIKEIQIPKVLPGTKHGRHLYTVWVNSKKRDDVLKNLFDNGIGVVVTYQPVHLMSYYREKYGYKSGEFPVAERIGDSTISLPFHVKLTDKEIKFVSEIVIKAVKYI